MLVSDGGTVIRVPVGGIRIASRATKGVTIFNTAEGEKVVSVERISEPNGEEEAEEPASNGGEPPAEELTRRRPSALGAASAGTEAAQPAPFSLRRMRSVS